MDDPDLMRELLMALVEDTSQQLSQMETAVAERNGERCKRLAHYSKGACANVGARSAAAIFERMERLAASGDFARCALSLEALASTLERLKTEVSTFQ